jgi:DNA processing protein
MKNEFEIGRYEALFDKIEIKYCFKVLFCYKRIHEILTDYNLLNELVSKETILKYSESVKFISKDLLNFGSIIYGSEMYPKKLMDLVNKLHLIYYMGNAELMNKPSIAIIGSRAASIDGLKRASKLTKMLVKNGFVIISGLAEGIDTAVHQACLKENGQTIAVIGTPLNYCYPNNNKDLMQEIAKNHLVISQIPFIRYEKMDLKIKSKFFPERNKTMSAISDATVIVEASDRSGTLTQARAALDQGRPLFILQNNFENTYLEWPKEFEQKGAIRVKNIDDILINISYKNQIP